MGTGFAGQPHLGDCSPNRAWRRARTPWDEKNFFTSEAGEKMIEIVLAAGAAKLCEAYFVECI